MSIALNISPRIIPNIATLYNDTNRIFMEYIDNSIDSAEEYYNSNTKSYSKKICIELEIHHDKVVIRDNCTGIINFRKVVEAIGNSDKKNQPWTNGQFGYGIYSFLAACDKIDIKTKLKEGYAEVLRLNSKIFDNDHINDVRINEPIRTDFANESGTEITLYDFKKSMWRIIDAKEIIRETESHFELLLKRANLQITINDKRDAMFHICKAFDYEQYDGDVYEESLNRIKVTKGKRNAQVFEKEIKPPVKIFLKVTKGRTINKPPVFISKGRRVSEIKDIKKFKSTNKSEIWGHPNITGFVDLASLLGPTIARNDFKNTPNSSALFNSLIELEPLILDVLKDVNKASEDEHFKILEDKLSSALSKLARIDAMSFRKTYLEGKEVNLDTGGSGLQFEDGFGGKDFGDKNRNNSGEPFGGKNEGEDIGLNDTEGEDSPGGNSDGDFLKNTEPENPFEDTGFTGAENKKSGFDIKFVEGLQYQSDTNLPVRSALIGGTIFIYKDHQDFKDRVDVTRTKELRISQRLLTYIAGEITVHYKDKLQTRYGQPEYNKQLFVNLVEFIYKFEDMVKGLVGLRLSELSGE